MSVAEARISKAQVFDSVDYFDHKVVGKEVRRWVFFPGDLIPPARKADITWLAPGGEETSSPCLQKYGRGFVPRGLASILEIGGELIPHKHLGELSAHAWSGVALNAEVIKSRLSFIPTYPGDGLKILQAYYSFGGRRGLDEIPVLVGKTWDECHTPDGDGILDVIERACYGDGVEPTLRGLENQIRHADVDDSRIDYGKYRADCLRMCAEFRHWGESRMGQENANIKLGTKGEWVFSYSPLAELLIAQLEMTRQDQPMQEMARMHGDMMRAAQTPVQQGLSAADMALIQTQMEKSFESKIEERLALARAADVREIADLKAELARKADANPRLVRRSVMRPETAKVAETADLPTTEEIADESGSE
jgi:hypothetical protein